jgi:hypothetical protein
MWRPQGRTFGSRPSAAPASPVLGCDPALQLSRFWRLVASAAKSHFGSRGTWVLQRATLGREGSADIGLTFTIGLFEVLPSAVRSSPQWLKRESVSSWQTCQNTVIICTRSRLSVSLRCKALTQRKRVKLCGSGLAHHRMVGTAGDLHQGWLHRGRLF